MLQGMGIETGVDPTASRPPARSPPGSAHAAVSLPAGRAARPTERLERPTATILVVDDLPANRDLMVRRLERSGFNVIAAASGPEALEVVGRGRIDLVLLDIMMPGMTGIDVLRTIRMSRSSAALPVVMVTAKTDSEDVVEALSLGANDYVTKPVDYPVALARIQGHLRTTKALRVEAAPAAIEPRSPAQAVPGTVLGGRYRLDQPIGGGSFGTVFRARHLELNRDVAVKILATSAGTDPEALKRSGARATRRSRVQHPNGRGLRLRRQRRGSRTWSWSCSRAIRSRRSSRSAARSPRAVRP
jgi:CheY-like chemotaxis protein